MGVFDIVATNLSSRSYMASNFILVRRYFINTFNIPMNVKSVDENWY